MLWWRIVGITDQQIHEKFDSDHFDFELRSCMNEVGRLIPHQQEEEEVKDEN